MLHFNIYEWYEARYTRHNIIWLATKSIHLPQDWEWLEMADNMLASQVKVVLNDYSSQLNNCYNSSIHAGFLNTSGVKAYAICFICCLFSFFPFLYFSLWVCLFVSFCLFIFVCFPYFSRNSSYNQKERVSKCRGDWNISSILLWSRYTNFCLVCQ